MKWGVCPGGLHLVHRHGGHLVEVVLAVVRDHPGALPPGLRGQGPDAVPLLLGDVVAGVVHTEDRLAGLQRVRVHIARLLLEVAHDGCQEVPADGLRRAPGGGGCVDGAVHGSSWVLVVFPDGRGALQDAAAGRPGVGLGVSR